MSKHMSLEYPMLDQYTIPCIKGVPIKPLFLLSNLWNLILPASLIGEHSAY